MDNVIIPDAPVSAPDYEKEMYMPPRPPVFASYTRITFDTKTGEMVKDKHVKSKNTAFIMHLLSLILGVFFTFFYGMGDFYCGRIARGFLKMLTGGGLMIWQIIDIVKVHKGEYETRGKCVLL